MMKKDTTLKKKKQKSIKQQMSTDDTATGKPTDCRNTRHTNATEQPASSGVGQKSFRSRHPRLKVKVPKLSACFQNHTYP